jgi:hypothetical protein
MNYNIQDLNTQKAIQSYINKTNYRRKYDQIKKYNNLNNFKELNYDEFIKNSNNIKKAVDMYDKHLKYNREYRIQFYHLTKDDNIEEQKLKNCIRARNFRLRNKDNDEFKEKEQIRKKLYYQKIKNMKLNNSL